jgi:ferric iron reductase protein FhuF
MAVLSMPEWATLADGFSLARTAIPAQDTGYGTDAIATTELLDPARCRELLDRLGPVIGSSSRAITASLLGKRIAFLTTASCLYAMTLFDKGLDLSVANSVTEYGHRDGLWRSRMVLKAFEVSCPAETDRAPWRQDVVERLFAGHLARLWAVFSEVSGVAPRILWENTAVRVYALYERKIGTQASLDMRDRVRDDLDYLVHGAPPSVFGMTDNPLARFYFSKTPVASGSLIRFRKTCCLYYKASTPVEYCSTCPLIRPGAKQRK